MAHYTPGLHLLAALAGAWTGTRRPARDLPAPRVLGGAQGRVGLSHRAAPDPGRARPACRWRSPPSSCCSCRRPISSARSCTTRFSPRRWPSSLRWRCGGRWSCGMRNRRGCCCCSSAAAGVGAFLTWPMWIGPPLVALAVTVLTRDDLRAGAKLNALALATVRSAAIVVLHTGRARRLARHGGRPGRRRCAVGRGVWLAVPGCSGRRGCCRPSSVARRARPCS